MQEYEKQKSFRAQRTRSMCKKNIGDTFFILQFGNNTENDSTRNVTKAAAKHIMNTSVGERWPHFEISILRPQNCLPNDDSGTVLQQNYNIFILKTIFDAAVPLQNYCKMDIDRNIFSTIA